MAHRKVEVDSLGLDDDDFDELQTPSVNLTSVADVATAVTALVAELNSYALKYYLSCDSIFRKKPNNIA
jgi:hypothetical protein